MNARVTILQEAAQRDVVADYGEPPLDDAPTDSTRAFDAEILALEQPVMELRTPQRVEPGVAARIDTAEAIWLGEVSDCAPAAGSSDGRGDGSYIVRIRLRHVLRDFETLARLAERFGTGAAKGIPVQI
jgi:hypothetical protein